MKTAKRQKGKAAKGEKSLLFTVAMARAWRDGLKDQTRRTMNPQPNLQVMQGTGVSGWCWRGGKDKALFRWPDAAKFAEALARYCPYGAVGDRLVLLTTWATLKKFDGLKPSELPAGAPVWSYFSGDEKPAKFGRLRMGRFLPKRLRGSMPRDTIKGVRVQRCQEISEADAIAEGVRRVTKDETVFKFCVYHHRDMSAWSWADMPRTAKEAYARLRDEINGEGTDAKNEWVWVLDLQGAAGGRQPPGAGGVGSTEKCK